MNLSKHVNVSFQNMFIARNDILKESSLISGVREDLRNTKAGLNAYRRKEKENNWSQEKLQKAIDNDSNESQGFYTTENLILVVASYSKGKKLFLTKRFV